FPRLSTSTVSAYSILLTSRRLCAGFLRGNKGQIARYLGACLAQESSSRMPRDPALRLERLTSSVLVMSRTPDNVVANRKRGPWVSRDDRGLSDRLTSSLTGTRGPPGFERCGLRTLSMPRCARSPAVLIP